MGLDLAEIATAFMSMMLEGLPFIFAGTLVSGVIDAYMPQGQMEKWLPKMVYVAIAGYLVWQILSWYLGYFGNISKML